MEKIKVAIIGMGYVGLPLAVEASKKYEIIGFDINESRINDLVTGIDSTLEIEQKVLKATENLTFSSSPESLIDCNFYIVTVPTPIDKNNKPDLRPLLSASMTIGKFLSQGDIVVYESTVYPGCTEEDCVPILEKESGLIFNQDFYCGYSPERINPGDKTRGVTDIKKVTSGSTTEIADKVDAFYKSIIKAGTHLASSIKIAEASKVIENAQRDINIAFVNELAILFDKMDLNTLEILEAAGTKWNFLPFRPGLVGGHCIGVDPYYLTYKAESLGYLPEVILSGRRINDNMGKFIASDVIKLMARKKINISTAKVLMLGITFKENCPDIRNSKVIDIIDELRSYAIDVDVFDPLANNEEVQKEYNVKTVDQWNNTYQAIVLAVAHVEFHNVNWEKVKNDNCVLYDVKGILPKGIADKVL